MRISKGPWQRSENGAWYVTHEGKQVNLGRDYKKAVRRWHELLATEFDPSLRTPVVVLLDRFIEWNHKHRSARTAEWYQENLQRFANYIGKRLTVDRLTPRHVENWIRDDFRGLAGSTKHGAIRSVKRACNWGVANRYIPYSPVAGIEMPATNTRERIITDAEWEIIRGMCDGCFLDLLTTLWETGCRPQEIRLVEARHVELDKRRWRFPRSESKGKKRERHVYLPDASLEITRRLALKWPDGALFRNGNGQPWTRNATRCRFRRINNVLESPISCYTFRHTRATKMLEQGIDSHIVAKLLGHTDTRMLDQRYSHIDQLSDHLAAIMQGSVDPAA